MAACKRCGGNHFNFVSCADHAVAKAKPGPQRVYRPREGEKDFGNRLLTSSVNKADPNVVYVPRKAESAPRWEPTGGVVEYPKFFPDEAA